MAASVAFLLYSAFQRTMNVLESVEGDISYIRGFVEDHDFYKETE